MLYGVSGILQSAAVFLWLVHACLFDNATMRECDTTSFHIRMMFVGRFIGGLGVG